MDHVTFAGGDPDLEIGQFTTRSKGWGDTKVAALFRVHESGGHSVVAKAGISLPTGDTKERDAILNPMGMQQDVRLPYAMQLGSGTYDLEPGVTYTGGRGPYGWGAQYEATLRLGENSQNYTLGDKHSINLWGSYQWNEWLQNSVRIKGEHEAKIDGRDTQIAGPVQTANPDNYGGKRVEVSLGLTLTGTQGRWENQGIGVEITLPVYQDLNGPQMDRDYGFVIGYTAAF